MKNFEDIFIEIEEIINDAARARKTSGKKPKTGTLRIFGLLPDTRIAVFAKDGFHNLCDQKVYAKEIVVYGLEIGQEYEIRHIHPGFLYGRVEITMMQEELCVMIVQVEDRIYQLNEKQEI